MSGHLHAGGAPVHGLARLRAASAQGRNAGSSQAAGASQAEVLRECDDCALLVRLPAMPVGTNACCPRCDAVLRRYRAETVVPPFALALTSFIFCVVTLTMPFLTLNLFGRVRASDVESGAPAFLQDGLWMLAILLVATVAVVPLARLGLRMLVLWGITHKNPSALLPWLLRLHEKLAVWSMLEVFLFGALVSYTRLQDIAHVQFGPAAYGLAAVVVAMIAADLAFDAQAAWDVLERRGVVAKPELRARQQNNMQAAAGDLLACHCCHRVDVAREGSACMRCGTTLHRRFPQSEARCWALVIAALVMYVPANLYPVMTIITLGQGGPHTIMGGVVEFLQSGFWPLALIVFIASVAVPMLKLVGLSWMLLDIRFRSRRGLVLRTKLYRVILAIGRWSMIDVFVVAILAGLVRFGNLASITADIGAACFGAVVVLTILAAEVFDPRLMWDAAGSRSKRASDE